MKDKKENKLLLFAATLIFLYLVIDKFISLTNGGFPVIIAVIIVIILIFLFDGAFLL